MCRIEPEAAADIGPREALLDRAFGPGRHLKTSARMRAGRLPAAGLALVARDEPSGALVGTVRLWHVALGDIADGSSQGVFEGDGRPALMLGPIGVEPDAQGAGVGARLMRFAIARAAGLGYAAIILVGDPAYYGRFGFSAERVTDLRLPGPVERHRFLGLELVNGALGGAAGLVRPTGMIAAKEAGELAIAV